MMESAEKLWGLLKPTSQAIMECLAGLDINIWGQVTLKFVASPAVPKGRAAAFLRNAYARRGVHLRKRDVTIVRSLVPGWVVVQVEWEAKRGRVQPPAPSPSGQDEFYLAWVEDGPSVDHPYENMVSGSQEAPGLLARLHRAAAATSPTLLSPRGEA